MRAVRNLDGKSCPGEEKCLSNKVYGQIGGVHGRVQGRTLENYCHDAEPNKENGLHKGCPLYPTKPESTPPSLYAAIDTAETLRRYKQRGCLPSIHELTAWEFCCFDTAEEASDKIDAEFAPGADKNSKETPLGISGEEGEDSAFSNW